MIACSRKYFYTVATLSALMLTSDAMAQISPKAFKNITRHFREGKKAYSPVLGEIALENGLIHNLRFHGNSTAQDNQNNNREYIYDKARDPLFSLVKTLFPSPTGRLAVETSAQDNFGQHVKSPKVVALLLNYANDYRNHLEDLKTAFSQEANVDGQKKELNSLQGHIAEAKKNKSKELKELENKRKKLIEQIKLSENKRKDIEQAFKGKKMQIKNALLKELDFSKVNEQIDRDTLQILTDIEDSIQEEKGSIYPVYTTEQVLSAFFCRKFDKQEDIWNLLKELNEDIINKTYPLPSQADLLTKEDIKTIAQKKDPFNLDDMYALANSGIFGLITPYKAGQDLTNGTSYPYDRINNCLLENTRFPDCGEISARHIMNLLSYNAEKDAFDLTSLENMIKDANPYFKNFKDFYFLQTPEMASAGDLKMNSAWSKVMGDLNAYNDSEKKISYKYHDIEIQDLKGQYTVNVDHEFKAGFVNFVYAFEKIFGLTLEPRPVGESFDAEKAWLNQSLNTIFATVNPNRVYEMDLSKLEQTGPEISGTIPVTVKNQDETEDLFSFDFYEEYNKHTQIENLQILTSFANTNYNAELESHQNDLGRTADDSLWLMVNPQKAKDHFLYALFNKGVMDDNARIAMLRDTLKNYAQGWNGPLTGDTRQAKYLRAFLGNSLQNILSSLSRNDSLIVEKMTSVIVSLYDENIVNEELRDIIINNVKNVKFTHRYNSLLDKDNGNLTLLPMQNVTALSLSNFNVRNIKGWEELRSLKELDLSRTKRLEELSLCSMPNLTEISLTQSSVRKISGLEKLTTLKKLDVSFTENLAELDLQHMVGLEDLKVFNTGAKKIIMNSLSSLKSFNAANIPFLDELHLKNMENLSNFSATNSVVQKITMDKLPKLNEIKLLGTQHLKELNLQNMEELSVVDISTSGIEKISLKNLPKVQNLKWMKNTDTIQDIQFEDMPNLKEFWLAGDKVEKITMNNLSSLTELDLTAVPSLTHLVVQNMNNLGDISWEKDDSQIKSIYLENMDNLQELDFSSLAMLEHVVFKGSFANLKKISVNNASSLKTIEGLDDLMALKELDVQGTSVKINSQRFNVIDDKDRE